jgi:uncharacterized DUF497 family protein
VRQIRFEWDSIKAAKNFRKHGVTFEEASAVFDDPNFIMVVDDEHSIDEERFITIGLSNKTRLLMVAHTDNADLIRIISARKAVKKEEDFYAQAD